MSEKTKNSNQDTLVFHEHPSCGGVVETINRSNVISFMDAKKKRNELELYKRKMKILDKLIEKADHLDW